MAQQYRIPTKDSRNTESALFALIENGFGYAEKVASLRFTSLPHDHKRYEVPAVAMSDDGRYRNSVCGRCQFGSNPQVSAFVTPARQSGRAGRSSPACPIFPVG